MRLPLHRAVLLALLATVVAGCSGGARSGSVSPSVAQLPTAISRSPASVPIPPMQGLTGTRPAMSLRKPQNEINALSFTQLQGAAVGVAASPDGTFWVLSTQGVGNGDQYIYHYTGGGFINVPGAASRIAVGPDATPWVLNTAGGIYHLVNGAFVGIAGGAAELSVGGTASTPLVDVISDQAPGPYGASIFQYNVDSGTWSQLPGAGVTIASSIDSGTYPALNINPGGFYVTNQGGGIFYYNVGAGFEQLPGGAVRLAPTASGGIFALGDPSNPVQHGIYYNDLNTGQWTQMPGAAVSISANRQDLYAIGAAGGIYVSQITTVGSGSGGGGAPLTGPNLGYATGSNIGGWGPTAVANALEYPVQSGYNGSGYTVAIVVDANYIGTDLSTFMSYFQTPETARKVSVELVDGALQSSTDGEAALDVETVAGLAPGANIVVYVIPTLSSQYYNDAYEDVVVNRAANIVSSSFSGCEAPLENRGSTDSTTSNIFANGTSLGITFVAASGDQGTACADGKNSSGDNLYLAGVGYPASDPNVVAVGGNETFPNRGITLTNPVVWNDDEAIGNAQEASGGGVSSEFALPSYQNPISGKASTQYRNVPDVALPAAYAAVVYEGSWVLQAGTSWSTPEFAAMLAEIYQYCNTAFNNAVSLPYAAFNAVGYNAFINVTSGNNGYPLTDLATPTYYATGGYNDATGIGIPLGLPFAETVCPNHVPLSGARAAFANATLAHSRSAQAYSVNVTPAIRGLVDEGRKGATDIVRIQLGIEPGDDIVSNEAAVIQALKANGFTIVKIFSNHLLVDATGPSESVEQLFSTQMHNALQSGKAVYLPEMPITVPISIAPYASGVILDDVVNRFYPHSFVQSARSR